MTCTISRARASAITARVPYAVLVIFASVSCSDNLVRCASSVGSYVNEKTGTKYCGVASSGLGHCPEIAFINKGFAKLVRTIPPVFPSWLVVAL